MGGCEFLSAGQRCTGEGGDVAQLRARGGDGNGFTLDIFFGLMTKSRS